MPYGGPRSLKRKAMYITAVAFVKRELGQFLNEGGVEKKYDNFAIHKFDAEEQNRSGRYQRKTKKKSKIWELNTWGSSCNFQAQERKKLFLAFQTLFLRKTKKNQKEAAALMSVLKARKKFKRVWARLVCVRPGYCRTSWEAFTRKG